MAAEKLKCKECGNEYPLEALYVCERCFGPLEVAYDHSRLDDVKAFGRAVRAGTAGRAEAARGDLERQVP